MEASDYHFLKYFLMPSLLLFIFFWKPYNPNVDTLNAFLEISETVLFFSFFFYSVLLQLFPAFYLTAYLSILLPQLFSVIGSL